MADKPILFSAPMVRALLDGRKTQTRRVMPSSHPRFPLLDQISMDVLIFDPEKPEVWYWDGLHGGVGASYGIRCAVGDRLWVRESFAVSGIGWGKKPKDAKGGKVHYRADPDHGWQDYWGNWRPSIHMPRWASRLTLIVTDVRVQRLWEISRGDAMAEGCPFANMAAGPNPCVWFADLWNSINGPGAWGANPWVAAYSFRVIRANIDSKETAK